MLHLYAIYFKVFLLLCPQMYFTDSDKGSGLGLIRDVILELLHMKSQIGRISLNSGSLLSNLTNHSQQRTWSILEVMFRSTRLSCWIWCLAVSIHLYTIVICRAEQLRIKCHVLRFLTPETTSATNDVSIQLGLFLKIWRIIAIRLCVGVSQINSDLPSVKAKV